MASYASSFLSVQNSVISKLRLDATDDLARVKEYINQVYTQVAVETRCLVTSATAALTQDTASYTMPVGVLHIQELTLNDSGGQVYPPLVESTLDRILRLRRFNTAVGPPRYYTLAGLNQLEFWPSARSTDVLTFWYTYLPDELTGDDDVSELPEPFGSKLLEYGALVQGAEFAKDPLLPEFQQLYSGWLASFQRFLNRRGGNQPGAFEVWGITNSWGPVDRSSDWGLTGWPR